MVHGSYNFMLKCCYERQGSWYEVFLCTSDDLRPYRLRLQVCKDPSLGINQGCGSQHT